MTTRSKAAGEPRSCQVVVLAAGEGTRMRSSLPKVLHRVAGRPLVAHVLAAATGSGAGRVAVVVGPGADATARLVTSLVPGAAVFEQTERKGTAHAVLAARAALAPADEDVLVLYGDTPLLRPATLMRLREALAAGADLAVAGFRTDSPEGYGRLIMDGGRLVAIREQRDATPAEQAIRFCNGGLMAFRGERILSLLDRIGNANSKREFYLTDAVSIATSDGLAVAAVETDAEDVIGVNTQAELAEAERLWQARARQAALDRGTTLVAPDTVHFAYDTEVAPEAVIEPYVVFGPGAVVEGGATVRAFSHVEGARIAAGATIGPYARLRPGAEIGAKARIGNFVEVKNASVAAGAKVNHLSYIGDASIGEKANIGAGTITCNYDGVRKHRTTIGAGAFIGSNSALVAPVSIGDGAYVGSGSVISRDVPADALAIARGQQVVKPGWAARFRAMFQGGGQAD